MFDLCDVTQSDVSAESLKHSRNTSLKKIKFTVKNVTFDLHFQTSEVKKIKINRHLKRGKKRSLRWLHCVCLAHDSLMWNCIAYQPCNK